MPEFKEEKDFGTINKNKTNSIKIRAVSREKTDTYLDLRTYVKDENYRGYTKKGLTINKIEDMEKLRENLDIAIKWFKEKQKNKKDL